MKLFQDEPGSYKYRKRINQMAFDKRTSLIIDFQDILSFDDELASRLIEEPKEIIQNASSAIMDVMGVENTEYANQMKEFTARISGLSDSQHVHLRGIRAEHLNQLVSLEGTVTRATPVKQLLTVAVFRCTRCKEEVDVPQERTRLQRPMFCPNCSRKGKEFRSVRTTFQLVLEKSEYLDWQKVALQEKPEELPPGQLPRSVETILTGDLVDQTRPGDRTVLTGILTVVQEGSFKTGPPIFHSVMEANNVEVATKENLDVEITEEDEKRIKELSQRPDIREFIVNSIAPSIYGYKEIKRSIASLLLGGVPKVYPDGVKVRGDIHVLLIGDPGTAKSQLLRYVASIAPRGIYTTGKGSTAAGLTAAVIREKTTGEFYLEAGALVLADRGIANIDEFDKMDPRDRVSIHEAMEQQSYHPSFELFSADGNKVKICDFVNGLMKEFRNYVLKGENCEILPLMERNHRFEVLTTDFERIYRIKVDRVSRHTAPKYFIGLKYSNGREILVTPEHPVFVLKDDRVTTIPACEVRSGDFAPGLRTMPELDARRGLLVEPTIDGGGREISSPRPSYESHSHHGSSYEMGFFNTNPVVLESDRPSGASERIKQAEPPTRYSVLRIERIEKISNEGRYKTEWVYDVTVEPTHTFISHGIILHNTISVAKAGIVATLNSRASILAAANPAFGRYLTERPVSTNIDLPVTVLSRFDLIFLIIDRPDKEEDEKLARYVLDFQSEKYPEPFTNAIPGPLLKKYIAYAREHVNPKISDEAKEKLVQFYLDMRRRSESPDMPITITPRQLEAVTRIAEANARMGLSDTVTEKDAEDAIELMMHFLRSVGLDVETKTIDIDIIMTGQPRSQREKMMKIMDLIKEMIRENIGEPIRKEDLIERAASYGIPEEFTTRVLKRLHESGEILEPKYGYIMLTSF